MMAKHLMLQDKKGYIYYIIQKKGEIIIMEGNPNDPYLKRHQEVFNLKTPKCKVFSI